MRTFVRLHADAADYVAHWYADPVVHTAGRCRPSSPARNWATFRARSGWQTLPNMSTATLESLDWSKVQILVVFSRNWDPNINLMRLAPMLNFWESVYDFVPNATAEEARARVPFPIDAVVHAARAVGRYLCQSGPAADSASAARAWPATR